MQKTLVVCLNIRGRQLQTILDFGIACLMFQPSSLILGPSRIAIPIFHNIKPCLILTYLELNLTIDFAEHVKI